MSRRERIKDNAKGIGHVRVPDLDDADLVRAWLGDVTSELRALWAVVDAVNLDRRALMPDSPLAVALEQYHGGTE